MEKLQCKSRSQVKQVGLGRLLCDGGSFCDEGLAGIATDAPTLAVCRNVIFVQILSFRFFHDCLESVRVESSTGGRRRCRGRPAFLRLRSSVTRRQTELSGNLTRQIKRQHRDSPREGQDFPERLSQLRSPQIRLLLMDPRFLVPPMHVKHIRLKNSNSRIPLFRLLV